MTKELNAVKDEIQQQAHTVWIAAGRNGTVAAGTGFGKSRIPILEMERMLLDEELTIEDYDTDCILLVSPTEKLRDENWPAEFDKWEMADVADKYVKRICFASLKNEKGNHYKLVILDEIHRLTDLSAGAFEDVLGNFFIDNLCDAVMGLTATVPDKDTDREKYKLIQQIAPVCFTYTLDQGVEDGMIADYEIRVIYSELDSTSRVYAAGSKAKPFKTTEAQMYKYLESMVLKSQIETQGLKKNIKDLRLQQMVGKFTATPAELKAMDDLMEILEKKLKKAETLYQVRIFKRNQHLYGLPSKQSLAKRCLKQMVGSRTLVFCGNIPQAEALCAPNTFHSKSNDVAFKAFNAKQVDTLGVVNAANEGINFVDAECALIVTIGNSDRVLTQRVGRCLRIRPGHKAMIYMLCAQDTVEERWLENSLKGFDSSKIHYYSHKTVPL